MELAYYANEDLWDDRPSLREVAKVMKSLAKSPREFMPSAIVYGLCDQPADRLVKIMPAWQSMPAETRAEVMRCLYEASETEYKFDYRGMAWLALDDEHSDVRAHAIDALWTDESPAAFRRALAIAETETDEFVLLAALRALSRFILLGEYGDTPQDLASRAQNLALNIHQDPGRSLELRRRALETLANSSHLSAPELIQAAYIAGNHKLKASAIRAMGSSCDKRWTKALLAELESGKSEYIYEAIQACGQIRIRRSAGRLGEFARSDDREIQMAAIWALGEIGGKRAAEILAALEPQDEEDYTLADAIEDAVANASFSLNNALMELEFD